MEPVPEPRWAGLRRAGGVAALVVAALLVGEIAVYALLSRPRTVLEHLTLLHDDPLAGLLTLDLLGMVAYVALVPTVLALHVTLRPVAPGRSAVGTALFFVGVASFFGSNTAFSVLDLSARYHAATSDQERTALLAAGQALFTLFNENAFLVSYLLVSAGWALVAAAMAASSLFGRGTVWSGVLAGVSGIVAVVLEHSGHALVPVAIGCYFTALVCLIGWFVPTGRALLRAGRG